MVYDQTMLGTPVPHTLKKAAEKRRFIRELIGNVQKSILAKVADMPDNWDGNELRRYIADCFEEIDMNMKRRGCRSPYRRRLRAYLNDVTVRNL